MFSINYNYEIILFWMAFTVLSVNLIWYLYWWSRQKYGFFEWLEIRAERKAKEKRNRARRRAERKANSPWKNITLKSRLYYGYSLLAFSFVAFRPGFKYLDYRDISIILASIAAGIILFEAIRDTRINITTVSASLEKMPPEQKREALRLIRSIQKEEKMKIASTDKAITK